VFHSIFCINLFFLRFFPNFFRSFIRYNVPYILLHYVSPSSFLALYIQLSYNYLFCFSCIYFSIISFFTSKICFPVDFYLPSFSVTYFLHLYFILPRRLFDISTSSSYHKLNNQFLVFHLFFSCCFSSSFNCLTFCFRIYLDLFFISYYYWIYFPFMLFESSFLSSCFSVFTSTFYIILEN